ncbi:MAG: NUDIX hydrolase [Bacteroidota bacterium]
MGYPKIINKSKKVISPWVQVVEKEVIFDEDGKKEVYHGITQNDYVAVLAIDSDGLIPIVKQYRPIVESYTWEFPAGTIDGDETPLQAAKRELEEESGYTGGSWEVLGQNWPDTGRLDLKAYNFFARDVVLLDMPQNSELETRSVKPLELKNMINEGEFSHQLHIALIGAVLSKGINVFSL